MFFHVAVLLGVIIVATLDSPLWVVGVLVGVSPPFCRAKKGALWKSKNNLLMKN